LANIRLYIWKWEPLDKNILLLNYMYIQKQKNKYDVIFCNIITRISVCKS
jgi:hypothetical protein